MDVSHRIKVKPFPIFLDSPMAIEATKIYVKHEEIFDDEMKAFISIGRCGRI